MSVRGSGAAARLLSAGGVGALVATSGLALGALGGDGGPGAAGAASRAPRNVIFVNGDGMGPAHREAARLRWTGFGGQLVMDSLPVAGLQTTDARDPEDTITDSAASASAWATGVKTYNGAISVDVDGRPLPVLGARAKAAGKATGLVTTAQVTDATPAAFFSNSADRGAQDDIARQYLDVTRPDVVLGGGEDWWLPAGTPGAHPDRPADDPSEGSRGTKGDLVQRARSLGYQYVTSPAQLRAARGPKLLGLFANQEMFQQRPEGQGDEYDPAVPLADMTRAALRALAPDKDGFFLLVEEEGVDEMSHNNNGTRMLQAMAALDAAVAVAKQYVRTHPDTLLVVTGDHECGGLTLEDVDAEDEGGTGVSAEDGPFPVARTGGRYDFALDWTTTGHTGVTTPVTAYGRGSAAFTGVYPNTRIHDVILRAFRR